MLSCFGSAFSDYKCDGKIYPQKKEELYNVLRLYFAKQQYFEGCCQFLKYVLNIFPTVNKDYVIQNENIKNLYYQENIGFGYVVNPDEAIKQYEINESKKNQQQVSNNKYCPKCGMRVIGAERYCADCGAKIE